MTVGVLIRRLSKLPKSARVGVQIVNSPARNADYDWYDPVLLFIKDKRKGFIGIKL